MFYDCTKYIKVNCHLVRDLFSEEVDLNSIHSIIKSLRLYFDKNYINWSFLNIVWQAEHDWYVCSSLRQSIWLLWVWLTWFRPIKSSICFVILCIRGCSLLIRVICYSIAVVLLSIYFYLAYIRLHVWRLSIGPCASW